MSDAHARAHADLRAWSHSKVARDVMLRTVLFISSAALLNGCSGAGSDVGANGGTATGGRSGSAGNGHGGSSVGGGPSNNPTGGLSGSSGGETAQGGAAVVGVGGSAAGAGGGQSLGGSSGRGGTAGNAGASGAAGAAGTGGGTPGSGTCGGGTVQTSDITIDESALQQSIRGFGVSSAWSGSYANASDPDYLWSTTKGAGLSLLRIRYGDGLTIAKAAAKAGVTVWLTPWGTGNNGSPGGSVTTTQTDPNGCKGSMPVLTDPKTWAANLVSWVQNAAAQGVPLYAVSAENEPDSCGINQTTSFSAAQLTSWIGGYLGPAMAPLGIKVMGPETQNVCGFKNYFAAIQGDAAAWKAVDIFASHEYGCGTLPSEPSIAAANKEYWETEVDTGSASGDSGGGGIASALLTVTTMHNDLVKANLNAWHYWWLYCNNNSGCLYDTGKKAWAKRLWAMGNFSRFVRPGWKRISTSGTSPAGVLLSAYIDPASSALAIVAINNNAASSKVSFFLNGNAPCSLTPYETSASKDLAAGTNLAVSQSRVTVTLSAQSVTTLVGKP